MLVRDPGSSNASKKGGNTSPSRPLQKDAVRRRLNTPKCGCCGELLHGESGASSSSSTSKYALVSFSVSQTAKNTLATLCTTCQQSVFSNYAAVFVSRFRNAHDGSDTGSIDALSTHVSSQTFNLTIPLHCPFHHRKRPEVKEKRSERDKNRYRQRCLAEKKDGITGGAAERVQNIQAKFDSTSLASSLSKRSLLGYVGDVGSSPPLALDDYTHADCQALSTGGINLDTFGNPMPRLLKQMQHWLPLLRQRGAPGVFLHATLIGRASDHYGAVMNAMLILICLGRQCMSKVGIHWLNTAFGARQGLDVERTSTLRPAGNHNDKMSSLPACRESAQILADILCFLYELYVSPQSPLNQEEEEVMALPHGSVDLGHLKKLLEAIGFPCQDGDSQATTVLPEYALFIPGSEPSDWDGFVLPNQRGCGRVAKGIEAASLLVCALVCEGGETDSTHQPGSLPLGSVFKLEQALVARSIKFAEGADHFSTASMNTTKRHLNAALRGIRLVTAFVTETLTIGESSRAGRRECILKNMQILVGDSCLKLLLGGRFNALLVPRALFAGVNRFNTAAKSEDQPNPCFFREIRDDNDRFVGAEFKGFGPILLTDFALAQQLCFRELTKIANSIASLFAGPVASALISLWAGRVTSITNDEEGNAGCTVHVTGSGVGNITDNVRIANDTSSAVKTWLTGSGISARLLRTRVGEFSALLCAALLLFGSGPATRGTDIAETLLQSDSTSMAQMTYNERYNGGGEITIAWIVLGAKAGSSAARRFYLRQLSTRLTIAVMFLRCLVPAFLVANGDMDAASYTKACRLLMRADGKSVPPKDAAKMITDALKKAVGTTLPIDMGVLDYKHFDSCLYDHFNEHVREGNTAEGVLAATVRMLSLESLSQLMGHSVPTDRNCYALRQQLVGPPTAETERQRARSSQTGVDFCRWRTGGDLVHDALFQVNGTPVIPIASGSGALVDFAARVYVADEGMGNLSAEQSVTLLVEAMSKFIASTALGMVRGGDFSQVDYETLPRLRENQVAAIVRVLMWTVQGESGVVVAPMSSGKTIVVLGPAIMQKLLREGSCDQLFVHPHQKTALQSFCKTRDLQLTVVVSPLSVLTRQYLVVTHEAGLTSSLLRPHSGDISSTPNTLHVLFIAPELLVRSDSIRSLFSLTRITNFIAFDEFHIALETRYWRLIFQQFEGVLADLQIPRVLFSGTIPVDIVRELAKMCGLPSSSTNLPVFRCPVVSTIGDPPSTSNLWSNLSIDILTVNRGNAGVETHVEEVALRIVEKHTVLSSDTSWSSDSVALVLVHTVEDTHQLANALTRIEGITAAAVHREKDTSHGNLCGCASTETCAMACADGQPTGDLHTVLAKLVNGEDTHDTMETDTRRFFIVATGIAATGLNEPRIQLVFTTPMFSLSSMFQGLCRGIRRRGRTGFGCILSFNDYASLTGFTPPEPPPGSFDGGGRELLGVPWAGENLTEIFRQAVNDVDFMRDQDSQPMLTPVQEREYFTSLFLLAHQLLFEDGHDASLNRFLDCFGGSREKLLLDVGLKPTQYNSGGSMYTGDLESTPQIAATMLLETRNAETQRVLAGISLLMSSDICLHCGQSCLQDIAQNLKNGHICGAVLPTNGCKRCLSSDATHVADACNVFQLRDCIPQNTCFECFSPMCTVLAERSGNSDHPITTGQRHPCYGARTSSLLMGLYLYQIEWLRTFYGIRFETKSVYIAWLKQVIGGTSLLNFHKVLADYCAHFFSAYTIDPSSATLCRLLVRPTSSICRDTLCVDSAVDEMRRFTNAP